MKPSWYFVQQGSSNRDGMEQFNNMIIHMEKKTVAEQIRTCDKGCTQQAHNIVFAILIDFRG